MTTDKQIVVPLNQVIRIQALLAKADFDLDVFMYLVVEQMEILTPATGVVIELVDGDDMVYRAATGSVAEHVGLRLPIKNSISGLCVSKNIVLISDDTEEDPRVNLEACRAVGARSLIVAPLTYQGSSVGVLKILFDKPNGYREIDVQTIQLMAGFIASGIAHQILYDTNRKLLDERTKTLEELQQAQAKLEYLARYDTLTDLPNRRYFNEYLALMMAKVQRSEILIGLMYFDIDHFKTINDTLGHQVGDELLKAFAGRIKASIRKEDFAARLGGDEFVVLLEEIHEAEDAIKIANKILHNVSEKFKFGTKQFNITTSIGITLYSGSILEPDQLIKQADSALYQAKEAGRNTYKIYSQS